MLLTLKKQWRYETLKRVHVSEPMQEVSCWPR